MAYSVEGISGPFAEKLDVAMQKLVLVTHAAAAGVQLPGVAYTRWFGAADSGAKDKIKQIVTDIDDTLRNRHVTLVNAVGDDDGMDLTGVYGYTFSRNIQIYNQVGAHGTTFVWMVPKANTRELVLTLYHELSHAIGGTDDLTYSLHLCQFYAQKNPYLAANNAENYCQFAAEFY